LGKGSVGSFSAKPLQDFLDDPNRSMAANWYKQTSNPLFAWEMIELCLQRDLPFPPEVKAYLGTVSQRMARLPQTRMSANERRKAVADSVVPSRLGRGGSFENYRILRRDWAIVCSVDEMKLRSAYFSGAKTLFDVYEAVSETCRLTPNTVKKIYEKKNLNDQVWVEEIGPPRRKTRTTKGR
jgi:hypothetical protein